MRILYDGDSYKVSTHRGMMTIEQKYDHVYRHIPIANILETRVYTESGVSVFYIDNTTGAEHSLFYVNDDEWEEIKHKYLRAVK